MLSGPWCGFGYVRPRECELGETRVQYVRQVFEEKKIMCGH